MTRAPHFRWDKREVRYLVPAAHQLASTKPGCGVVGALFFISYNADSKSTLTPIRKTEAVHRLLKDECYVPVRLTSPYVTRLMDWMRAVDAYELAFADVDEAVDLTQTRIASP